MDKPIIFCVDDERNILDTLTSQIENYFEGEFDYEIASSGEEALELFEAIIDDGDQVALVISDHLMPGIKGDELLIQIHKINPESKKILLTGQAGTEAVANAINHANLYRYVSKPWDKTDLMLTIEEAVGSYIQKSKIEQQKYILESLYYSSLLLAKQNTLEDFIPKLIEVVVDNSSSDRACFIIFSNQEVIKNYNYINQKLRGHHQIIYDDSRVEIAQSVINKVLNSNKKIIVDNCMTFPWTNDAYINAQKPKSLACYPITLNNTLYAMIYLENYSSYNAYDDEIAQFLQLFTLDVGVFVERVYLYEQINKQKLLLEQKTNDITDSIQYASRIQKAFISNNDSLDRYFEEAFIYFKPKDIVSGDFYWYYQSGSKLFLVCADCTGHGVPGAFLSLFGINILDQIVDENKAQLPNYILDKLNIEFKKRLTQSNEENLQDGMDVSLCIFDFEQKVLHFSSAMRQLYLIRNRELVEYKGDKFPIGSNFYHTDQFTNIDIPLMKDDQIYVFSDGYPDQFGGERNKKYTTKRFQQLLLENAIYDMTYQKSNLEREFLTWKGGNDQLDDILVIGIKI